MTPTPRLVPDRPSDAAIAAVFWQRWISATIHVEAAYELNRMRDDAREIDATAPLAEAPAERGDSLNHADTLSQLLHSLHYVLYSGDWSMPDDTHRQLAGAYEDAKNGIGTGFIAAAPAAPAEDGHLDMALRISEAKAPRVTGGREVEALREALADLLSWFPDAPVPAEWRLPAGKHGADDAITAAHDALGHKTCRFCAWRGTPETAADPYTTDGTVEVCGGCNNAESFV